MSPAGTAAPVHPRVAVSAISSFRLDLPGDLTLWDRHGITAIGASVAKLDAFGWDDGLELLAGSGLRVVDLIGLGPFVLHDPSGWPAPRDRLHRALAAAEEVGIPLALEHTNSLRVDVGFVHTLRDAVDLARRLGTGVCLEVNACWAERDLDSTIRSGSDVLRLVQVSDFAVGTRATPDRLVPGDGDVPLHRILGAILDSGYSGPFELELVGPRIEEEGYDAAVPRAVAALGDLLHDLGA